MWVIVGAIVIFGGYYMINSKKEVSIKDENSMIEENNMPNTGTSVKPADGKKIPFSQLLGHGGSYKCTIHQDVNGTDTVGTTYVSDGMVSGQYDIKLQGVNMTSNVIVRDGYSYSWTSIMPSAGFKAKIVPDGDNPGASASGNYSWNANMVGDYDCQPWTVDASKFTLPSGVTWKDMSTN